MENASKALLIAAGIIISLLIITLLVVFYNQVSSYYSFKSDMTEAEQLEQFNSVYQNYQDKKIRGNELISVMNRIIDYNNLQAGANGYERIIINVDLDGHASDLAYDDENEILFKTDPINNSSSDQLIKDIAMLSIKLTTSAQANIIGLTDLKLQKLSSEIHNIVLEDEDDSEAKVERAKKLTKILGHTIEQDDDVEYIVKATLDYYQLTQFKRTMFRCTEVSFDSETGRVNGMKFQAVEDTSGNLEMD